MATLKDLKIGTVVAYNDAANINLESVILGLEETRFGSFVKVLKKETNIIELMAANTTLERYTVIANG